MSLELNPAEKSATDSFSHLRHELRTPLNQIIGYSEMLEEQAEDGGQQDFVPDLQKIQKAARNLLGIINTELNPSFADKFVLNKSTTAPQFTLPPAETKSQQKISHTGKILVVDDNEMNRDMLSRRLIKDGSTVDTACDGLDALKCLEKNSYDLVLLDIMMPGLDGYSVLQRMKADHALRHLPVIMISALDEIESVIRCIEAGADDYLSKPFNPTLLRARIGACLEKKYLRDQEQRTHRALVESQAKLAAELNEAAAYVTSLLPQPLEGDVSAQWRFVPSTELGGDAFGYYWMTPQHFIIYLLDVCGHGVGAALLSISAMNVIRGQSLRGVNFTNPGAVLSALNETFEMEKHNNMYFTIWYGVFDKKTRLLQYASGGHPPALIVANGNATPLRTPGMVIGSLPGVQYKSASCTVPPNSSLFVFSDGAYEINKESTGEMMQLPEFSLELQTRAGDRFDPDQMISWVASAQGKTQFDDDLSLVHFFFK